MFRLLITYGSKRGSTREVVEAIASVARDRGFEIEIRRGGEKITDVGEYAGVVIGGALYRGRLHRDARRFLKRHRRELQAMPVFVFAIGPRRDEQSAFDKARGELDRALARVPEINPMSVAVFGGVDRDKGIDLRDWESIRAWADTALTAAQAP
jgi:menaquinone-dependent protoporphyrinogen oxidase